LLCRPATRIPGRPAQGRGGREERGKQGGENREGVREREREEGERERERETKRERGREDGRKGGGLMLMCIHGAHLIYQLLLNTQSDQKTPIIGAQETY